jgi:phage baseplate assembly protein gpV
MSSHLHNAMRGIASAASQGRVGTKLGIVSAYDPARYAIKVMYPPDDVESGWIPLGALMVGNGYGILAPPAINDQVKVEFQDGALDAGIAGLTLFNDVEVPPQVSPGEIWLLHKSGAFFKLTNDGKASFSDGHGASVTLNGDGTISSAGTWTHTGNISFIGQVSANGHRIDDTHKHINSGGTGLGGVPQ